MGYEGAPRQHLSTHVEKQLELVANLLEVFDGLVLLTDAKRHLLFEVEGLALHVFRV